MLVSTLNGVDNYFHFYNDVKVLSLAQVKYLFSIVDIAAALKLSVY